MVKQLQLPLPPLEVQQQIVAKMDKALAIKRQKEAEAKELLESIDEFVLGELGIEWKEVEEKKVFSLKLSELGEGKRFDSFYNNPKFLKLEEMLNGGKYEVKQLNDFINDIRY
ncbi:MAG: hypothetical protein LBP53_06290 [Candidatus Peribacteria bacterium]|nr:hypothetical protein [Candidatus Peribacteria bacterium]